VSVIDTATDTVSRTILNVGVEPRGIAISNDGDADDTDETAYVTQFLALPIPGRVDGQDNAKEGVVTRISTATDSVLGDTVLNPIADTGFKALGDAIARIPPGDPLNPADFKFTTGAYPNQLNNIAIKGNFAFLPATGASPNGPVRFDVNTHSLIAVINRGTALDANRTINMHLAVKQQANTAKRFLTQPWAMAFKNSANQAYVVSAASNVVVKLAVDPATGAPTVQSDPLDPTKVLEIPTGRNPRGIVVNPSDTRAYVMNYVSRDVTVIDLTGPGEHVMTTMPSAALPVAGTFADRIHVGKELYNTSIGVFDPVAGNPVSGRMSANGWGSCAACHTPFGLSDNVVWIFPPGPRRTLPQHTDFDQTDPARSIMRVLNWSAERDEEEDFELNIRAVSGGQGMLVLPGTATQDPSVTNLRPLANGGRSQLKVRGVGGWDGIKAFVQFGIRAPISPVPKTDPDVVAGRALFISANCQQCHGGAQWTSSRVRFTPPPDASLISSGGEIIGELRNVGTFNPSDLNEVRQNGAPPLGANGFAPPSLLSIFAFAQTFLHNGNAGSLDDVMNNVTHRSAGTGGVDTMTSAADRAKVVKFLLSIDAATIPIPLP
jgi:mono/diheme cytochrome c family protein